MTVSMEASPFPHAVAESWDNGGVKSSQQPGSGASGRRRRFTAAEKRAHADGYEHALVDGTSGGVYLRQHGLYASQVAEWRRLRDAGVLDDAVSSSRKSVPKPTAEQEEIARLRRQLAKAERKLHTTEAALSIMGKAHALLESLAESADSDEIRGES